MATSGSVDFSLTRNQAIREALELAGVYEVGETPTPDDYDTCSRSLNMMLKTWATDTVKVWKRQTASLTLVASQQSYTLGPGGDLVIDKPLRIIEARRRASNVDTPVESISWQEYTDLSAKTTASKPTQYHYQPGLTTGALYVWPTADATTAADETLQLTYYSIVEDMDAASDDFDFPSEWTETVAYNLAVRIAPKFRVPLASMSDVVSIATNLYESLTSWSQEDSGVYFGVDYQ